jgi:hypothetical protein
MSCPRGGEHLWYSDTAHPCRVQQQDWCIKCGTSRLQELIKKH